MYQNYRQLGFAIAYQAVKDFFSASKSKRKVILKDLRSDWMIFLTEGMSDQVAEQLELRPDEIKKNLRRN